jgi:hypothetical protein
MARKSATAGPAPSSVAKGKAGTPDKKDSQEGTKTAEELAQEAQALAEKALKDEEAANAAAELKKAVVPAAGSVVGDFPATLSITNATQGSFDVVGTDATILAGATDNVTFETEKSYQRFTTHLAQLVELKGWKDGEGISIEGGREHD